MRVHALCGEDNEGLMHSGSDRRGCQNSGRSVAKGTESEDTKQVGKDHNMSPPSNFSPLSDGLEFRSMALWRIECSTEVA